MQRHRGMRTKEISMAGAPVGKETVVEKLVEGGQQPGLMVLVGHFKNFKVYSEVNGK